MRKTYILIAYFFILGIFVCGCRQNFYSKNQIITVNLPEGDSSVPEFSRWHIQIISQNIETDFFTSEISFEFEAEINQPLSIIAQPLFKISETQESDFFKPAGAIYPYFCNNGILQLTWESGFSATLLRKLFLSGKETGVTKEHLNDFLTRFNWKKFQSAISDNINSSSSNFYNPWFLDQERILSNLCMGIFQLSYLNLSYVYEFPVEKTGIPENISFYSSFIPENDYISKNRIITLKKNEPILFYFSENLGANLTCTSSKKVSLEVVYMPIFITGL